LIGARETPTASEVFPPFSAGYFFCACQNPTLELVLRPRLFIQFGLFLIETTSLLCQVEMFKRKTSSPDDDDDFDQDFGEDEEEFEEEPEDYIPELKRSKSSGDGSADDESGVAPGDEMDDEKSSLINRWKRTAPPAIEEQKESIGTYDGLYHFV
jgi:hypothetical protein